jgi:hypothetical protein
MKRLGRTAIAGGVLAAALLAAGLLVSTSPVQTWLVRRALPDTPGADLSVGRVDIGFGRVRLEELRLAGPEGPVITFPEIELSLPVLRLLSGRVSLVHVEAHGWTADFTRLPGSPNVSGGEPALVALIPGLLSSLELPADLSVETVDLRGTLVLPAAQGMPPARATVNVTGGGMGAGRRGSYQVQAETVLPPGMAVESLTATGELGLAMDSGRRFSAIEISADLDASGRSLPAAASLSVEAGASRANLGESYSLAVRSSGRSLFALTAAPIRAGAGGAVSRAGTWSVDMRAGDLTPFLLGRRIPEFEVRGGGRFTSNGALGFDGSVGGFVEGLEQLYPGLATVGRLEGDARFDIDRGASGYRVRSLGVRLSAGAAELGLSAVQEFGIDLARGVLDVGNKDGELLRLELGSIPAAWTGALLGPVSMGDGIFRGVFTMRAGDGDIALASNGPVSLTGIVLESGGRPLLSRSDFSGIVTASVSGRGWQADISDATLRSSGTVMMRGSMRAGRLAGPDEPLRLQGLWTGELFSLGAQPFAAAAIRLSSGTASGEFRAALGARDQFEGTIGIAGMVVEGDGARLPPVEAEFRIDREEDGNLSLNLPFAIGSGDAATRFVLAGNAERGSGGWALDVRVDGDRFAVPDILLFQQLFRPGPTSTGAAAPSETAAVAFWSGLGGRVQFSADRLLLSERLVMGQVSATVRIEPDALRINGLGTGADGSGRFSGAGRLSYRPGEDDAYQFAGEFEVEEFEMASLFPAAMPDRPPTLQGNLSASARLGAAGSTPAQLAERMAVELSVRSRGGVSRLLRADVSERLRNASSAISTAAGIIGAVTRQDRLSDFANRGAIVGEIAGRLEAMTFDQLNFVAVRGANQILAIRDLSLIAPEFRIDGAGAMKADFSQPLAGQEMLLSLELGVRGELAEQMRKVGLLDGRRDDLGYSSFITPFQMSGTLNRPDSSQFARALLRSVGIDSQ